MAKSNREPIAWDVHSHLVPIVPDRLASIDGVAAIDGKLEIDGHLLKVGELFEPTRLVDWMRANDVARALVSAPPPTYRLDLEEQPARQWTDYLNDGLTEICSAHEGVLEPMLHLPIRYPEVATEIVRAGEGASITHYSLPAGASGDLVLSDPAFDPLWSVLDARCAFVFIHPGQCCDGRLSAFYLENLLGNPYETTVAAAHILFGGVLERFPAIRFCLAHGGGTLPLLAGRWQRGFETSRPGIDTSRSMPAHLLQRFSVDCVMHSGAAIELATKVFGASNVLFGSDWPFPMGLTEPHSQLASIDTTLRRRILCDNARMLLRHPA
ncbi:MAG: amidohydrolase [Alphaproteobacteria bacterium]|nr:amidohydrolase [Alphaproteobacteria bacterium]